MVRLKNRKIFIRSSWNFQEVILKIYFLGKKKEISIIDDPIRVKLFGNKQYTGCA